MKLLSPLVVPAAFVLALLTFSQVVLGQKDPKFDYPTLTKQLSAVYDGETVEPDSELARLIAANQDFSMLRPDEFSDKRGLPPWLRVWWRKAHTEFEYTTVDPTKGYPLVLKEILEWMITHQDLKPGPGKESEENGETSSFVDQLVGTNVRVSGLQTVARSESYIQINYFNPMQILSASNNIGGTGRQGVYRSSDGGVTWAQSELPLQAGDSFHSDPTADYTNDRAWSSTLGINSAGSVLKLQNYVSSDNGATWTFDATVSAAQTNVDKQIVWVDKNSSSPFFGQMYAIWHNGNPAFMSRRTAGAAGTWSSPVQVSGAESTGTAIGGDVKTNSTGDVFGFWPTTTNARIIVTKSTNGGNVFGTPVQVSTTFDTFDTGIPSFSSRRALIYVSGGAYRTVSKNLVYATWGDLSGDASCTAAANEPGTNVASTCKTRIWFSRSTDGGATWSAKVKINNQAGLNDQFNQWMAVDETNGNLVVIYYDTVGDAGRKKTDVWYQTSFDDGVTWTTAAKVTTAMTDETTGSGADSGNQYGDYNGLSGYANSFFPSWTDRRSAAREEIWTALISLGPPPPPAPIIQSAGVAIVAENGVPANNSPDPGEAMTVSLGLQNVGNLNSSTVTATLQASGGVTIPGAAQNYGVLVMAGPVVTRNFTFVVNPAAVCGSSITLTWSVQDGAGTPFTVTQTYATGTPATSLTQNFDGVTAPALPAGWTQNQTVGTGITWVTSTTTPNSAPNNAVSNDPATLNATALESPVFPVTSANASLIFQKAFTTESTFDGVVLEIKVGAGAWTDIVTAGGVFASGGYNATISTGFSSPIAGRQAWSGTAATFTPTQVSLPAAANGQNVQVRWLMASDTSVASTGFRLDDVQVQAGTICATVPSATPKSRADFDGDGKTDLSVFRPSTGTWYLQRSTAGFAAFNWGISTDVLIPGDFDGDGKADMAVFRADANPANNDFYVLKSNGFVFQGTSWGVPSDIPIAGDYDGDGKADIAVFRPSSGTWFILNSGNGSNTVAPFGVAGDKPMAFDLENDGKTNLAVFRPSNNTWYIARNSGVPAQNFDSYPFGAAGDLLVPADYDGDNKDDVAVFRPSNGTWYIRRSSDGGTTITAFGTSGDIPVPGDYDGDGKDDVAIYRNGTWWLNRSTAGVGAFAFGLATDSAIPKAYIP